MPLLSVNGVDIYYEQYGEGPPLVLCHEFASDYRGWKNQVNYFSRRYRVVTYNHRGFPPSAVPARDSDYELNNHVEDLRQLMLGLGSDKAHIAGFASGAHVALHLGLAYPSMVKSLVLGGAGSGLGNPRFSEVSARFADRIATVGVEALIDNIGAAPHRLAYRRKDQKGWEEFLNGMRSYSPVGAASVMRVSIGRRKPVSALEVELKKLDVPVLVLLGDQDLPALESSLYLSRTLPHAGLAIIPMSGHTVYLEEPALFNQLVSEFLANVENGRWGTWSV